MPKKSGIELVAIDRFSKVFREYDKGLKKAETQTAKSAKSITTAGSTQVKSFDALGAAVGGLVAPAAIGAAAIAGVTAAVSASRRIVESATIAATEHQAVMSGLTTSANAANTEFGAIVGTTGKWRDTISELSDEMRIYSERDVAEATARTIDMTKRLGFSATQMEEVVARSGDLAAKTGTDLTGAVERVTAAMRGEAESAEFLGLTLSETFVKNNALRLGFEKTWKDMSEAEKAQVRYALFLEQSAGFLGSAAASTGTLSGAQKELNAALNDAQVALGKGMIPLTTQWIKLKITLAEEMLPVAQNLSKVIGLIHSAIAGAVAMAKVFEVDWADLLNPIKAGKVIGEIVANAAAGSETWEEAVREGGDAALQVLNQYREEAKAETTKVEGVFVPEPGDFSKQIGAFGRAFDVIQDLQADHADAMTDAQKDFAKESLEAEEEYLEEREDVLDDGLDKIESIEKKAAAKREKTIRDAEKDIAKEQESAAADRLKAQQDYEREAARSAEEFALDRVQSERSYQFEREQLVAEGDVLAIRELDERHALEQKEAQENQALQEKQAKETFDVQLSDMQDASRAVLDELNTSLAEQLAEQDSALSEQLDAQRMANVESLAELDARYAEEKVKDQERYAESLTDAEENYRRQLEAQGRALADQLREQGVSAEETEALLNRFFGDAGITDEVMAGFHEREDTRIILTGEMLSGLSQAAEEMAQRVNEAVSLADAAATALSGFQPGTTGLVMDEGGVVTGPANVRVGSGVTEMFTPLNRGGGHFSMGWKGNPIPLSGLEKATPANQDAVARALISGLISSFEEIRAN